MTDFTPEQRPNAAQNNAKQLDQQRLIVSSIKPNENIEEPIPDIREKLSLGIKQAVRNKVKGVPKTKARLAESLVNVAIAAMLENPSMDMKDMWPVLEALMPSASGDTFQRKLREKLRELNNPEIDRILKPRKRKRKVRAKEAGQRVSASGNDPQAKGPQELSQHPEAKPTSAQQSVKNVQGEIPKDFLLGLKNSNASGF